MSTKSKYNLFHKNTSVQSKTVKDDNFTYRLLLEVLNKYIKPKDKILDIGCGAGTIALYFANKRHSVLGIDISDKAIKAATESAKIIKLKNISFEVHNFPDETPIGKFDFIIFSEVIEHLRDDELAIHEINRLLTPKGRVLISTPSVNAPLHKLGYTKEFDKRVGHLRRYTEKQLIEMLVKNDFKIIKTKKIEGILRNFIFLNNYFGKFVKILNHSSLLGDLLTRIDEISILLFGNSNIIIVAQKK